MAIDLSPNMLQLEERLEEWLAAALSTRRTVGKLVERLSCYSEEQQQPLLHWLPILSRINPELAFQATQQMIPFLATLDPPSLSLWISAVIDRYDQLGLQAALLRLREGPMRQKQQEQTLLLDEMIAMLQAFVTALGGRSLFVASSEQAGGYTNTATLFLPASLAHLPSQAGNRTLYQSMAAHLWGLARFGTFFPQLPERLQQYADPEQAGRLYMILEGSRVDAKIAPLLPGLARFMASLQKKRALSSLWQEAISQLTQPEASAQLTLSLLPTLLEQPLPEALPYHGLPLWQPAMTTLLKRIAEEKRRFRQLLGETRDSRTPVEMPVVAGHSFLFSSAEEGMRFNMSLEGQPLRPPDELQLLLRSIVQDLGQMPPEYLSPAGSAGYRSDAVSAQETTTNRYDFAPPEDGSLFAYDEWDYQRNSYRKEWCLLSERPIPPGEEKIVQETLHKYQGVWQGIRRRFEMLRGEDQWQRRQLFGDEIDMDALLHAWSDFQAGQEMDERLFRHRHRRQRNVATLLLVDMSGSTKGWVNQAIRESLVLFSHALHHLQDRFALYGFSSMTRKQCHLYCIKSFTQQQLATLEPAIAGVQAMDYTRMGVFIRHASTLLNQQEAKTRLLITLSDGKPEDYDSFLGGYRGQYAIEDTRTALLEARRSGIHPFCITIDREARAYLPRLYGPARYVLLEDVRQLPLRIADIYRKLTSR
ncbi:nitric oxide reductase activation protein NorD [Candidatus Magnetaquicoccus inordinatus]|uniref:nitric oxide reductase activation protein NorD n=1 Tax=Candidatus Magnetaquicoccus inordinatus TaxID=2496818 RepID=UPI00102AA19B|nr:VWA domain-containing protein [Candidatus Magnetaquicoccus inordinatus]